jgi:hypothetical protein
MESDVACTEAPGSDCVGWTMQWAPNRVNNTAVMTLHK